MINILAEVSIEDYSKFIEGFSTRGLVMRSKHGSQESRVFKVEDDRNKVVILFKWESREAFDEFLGDPQVKETMRSSGTTAPPKFTFLEVAAEFAA